MEYSRRGTHLHAVLTVKLANTTFGQNKGKAWKWTGPPREVFGRWSKTALRPREQTETCLKIENFKSNKINQQPECRSLNEFYIHIFLKLKIIENSPQKRRKHQNITSMAKTIGSFWDSQDPSRLSVAWTNVPVELPSHRPSEWGLRPNGNMGGGYKNKNDRVLYLNRAILLGRKQSLEEKS